MLNDSPDPILPARSRGLIIPFALSGLLFFYSLHFDFFDLETFQNES